MEGSETATMFESSMIMNDTPEAQSSTRARRPLTHRAGRCRAAGADVRASCVMARPPLGPAEPRVIGDAEQGGAQTFAMVLAIDGEKFVLRRLPKRPRLAIFQLALSGQDDPPFASILRPRLKREIAISDERPQIVADRRAVGNERARQFSKRRRAREAGKLREN